jgi:choline dehydrogenase
MSSSILHSLKFLLQDFDTPQISTNLDVVLSKLPFDWPEAQYLFLPEALTPGTTPGATYGTAFAALIAPQSRGNVSISSSKMSDPPLINPNWLTNQVDKDILVAGFKRVREFVSSDAMSPIIIGDEFFPGTSIQTDDEILAYVEQVFISICHAHATNQMGKSNDKHAVVDSTGTVIGVKNCKSYPCR